MSFLAALLLYHFAVSDVQGFAYTLGLTTLIDVLVVFLFTKPMVTLLAGTRFFSGGHKWSGLDPERLGAKARWRSADGRPVGRERDGHDLREQRLLRRLVEEGGAHPVSNLVKRRQPWPGSGCLRHR